MKKVKGGAGGEDDQARMQPDGPILPLDSLQAGKNKKRGRPAGSTNKSMKTNKKGVSQEQENPNEEGAAKRLKSDSRIGN